MTVRTTEYACGVMIETNSPGAEGGDTGQGGNTYLVLRVRPARRDGRITVERCAPGRVPKVKLGTYVQAPAGAVINQAGIDRAGQLAAPLVRLLCDLSREPGSQATSEILNLQSSLGIALGRSGWVDRRAVLREIAESA